MCKTYQVKWSWHNQNYGFALKFQEENSQDFKPISGPVIGSGEELDVEDLYTKYKVKLRFSNADHNERRQYPTVIAEIAYSCSALRYASQVIYIDTHVGHMKGRVGNLEGSLLFWPTEEHSFSWK
jgi:hypothetical protein